MNGMRGKKKKVIIEEFINFDYEITLLTILDSKGKIHFCPPIGHVQERGDYQYSWQPANCEQKIVNKMKIIARKIVKDLNGKGLFGVEFFVKKDEVYFSELSPRPHDTGMVTMFTQNFSEFDLHARAILNFTIPKIELCKKGVSQVILANKNAKGKFLIKGIENSTKTNGGAAAAPRARANRLVRRGRARRSYPSYRIHFISPKKYY